MLDPPAMPISQTQKREIRGNMKRVQSPTVKHREAGDIDQTWWILSIPNSGLLSSPTPYIFDDSPMALGPGWVFQIWTQLPRQTLVPEELAGGREVRGATAGPSTASEATWTLTAHLTGALDCHDSRITPLASLVVPAIPSEASTCE